MTSFPLQCPFKAMFAKSGTGETKCKAEQMKVKQLTSKQLDTFRCPELPAVSSKSFYFADCSVFRVVAFTAAVESKQHTLELIRRRSLR